MSYASVSDVEARLPYRVDREDGFTSTTQPSLAQVQQWLDDAEAELNATLLAVGLPAPYSSAGAVATLRQAVTGCVEGRVRMAYASAGGDGNNDDGKDMIRTWQDTLLDIRNSAGWWSAKLGAAAPTSARSGLASYVTSNADGKSVSDGDFRPTFTRCEKF